MRPGAKADVTGTSGGAAGLGARLRRSPARCAARDYHHMGVVDVELRRIERYERRAYSRRDKALPRLNYLQLTS
jgi:hypothetical protein